MKEIMRTSACGVPSSEVIGDHTTTDFASMDKLCGALVQYPDTRGRFNKFEGIADALHKTRGETEDLLVEYGRMVLGFRMIHMEFWGDSGRCKLCPHYMCISILAGGIKVLK